MRIILVLAAVAVLSGCAGYNRSMACRDEAGPKPYSGADLFGAAGNLVVSQTDARQQWYQRVDQCIADKKLAGL